ncbi:hypothetical protein MRB53_027084 [Persea americana]|uniref:Uncharacterized protein n=1 Tax=Persea americana TaxID=3435 RepID=A0ACC2LKR0_PERAE|nr:hypothetical protein MRB53_027084 [Persea americana]
MDPLPVLRAFHEIERRVFLRLLNLGSDPYVAKKIIAFWLWMECICHSQLVLRIRELSNKDLRVVSREAEGALACVENSAERPPLGNGLSITSELLNLPVVMRFFHVHQETAKREISFFLDGVCSVVFEDIIEKRATRNAAGRPFNEGSSSSASSGEQRPNPLASQLGQGKDQRPMWSSWGSWDPMKFQLLGEEERFELFAAAAFEEGAGETKVFSGK